MSRLSTVANPHRQLYPSDLSDREWEIIKPLLPASKGFGRSRTVDLKEILNAVFYGISRERDYTWRRRFAVSHAQTLLFAPIANRE